MTTVVTKPLHFRTRANGRRIATNAPSPLAVIPAGRVPRVARLMALAIRFDAMLRSGEVESASALARRFGVTQARMSQILALTLLAPDIIEQLLFLPPTVNGRDAVIERDLRPIAALVNWEGQRHLSSRSR